MASLVVDAAYVHHGTAAASADNINGWSEAALKRIKPKAFKRRLESALGLSIERACWCARPGRQRRRRGDEARQAAAQGGLRNELPSHKDGRGRVSQPRLRRGQGTCPHLHRSNPVRCRRQAGVDVDVACRALQFITEQLMSEHKLAVVDVDARPAGRAALARARRGRRGLPVAGRDREAPGREGRRRGVAAVGARRPRRDFRRVPGAGRRRRRLERGRRRGGRRRRREQRHSSSRRRRRSSCRRSCPSVVTSWRGGADAARSRRRAVARSPSRRCWRASTRRRRTTVETTTSLRGPSRNRPDSTPSRSASAQPGGTPSSNRAMKSRIPPSWRRPASWKRPASRRCGIRSWRSRHSSGRPGAGKTGRVRGTPSSIPTARTASPTPGRAIAYWRREFVRTSRRVPAQASARCSSAATARS